MYADIVDLESLSLTPANKLVTVCGYVRKVLITFNFQQYLLIKLHVYSSNTVQLHVFKTITILLLLE